MKKRKGSLLQRMMAVLLSAVLVTGMAAGEAPAQVFAAGNTEAGQETTGQPETEQGTTDQPETEQGTAAQPETEQETTAQPETEQGTSTQPETEQGTAAQPETEQGTTDQPETEQGASVQPETEQGTTAQPETEQGTSAQPETAPTADYEAQYSTDGGNTWKKVATLFDIYWKEDSSVDSANELRIEILRDITLVAGDNWASYQQTTGRANATWIIDGNGHTITRGDGADMLFCVDQPGSKVTLRDIIIDGGAIWSSSDPATRTNSGQARGSKNAHLIYVDGGAELVFESGVILQNSDMGGFDGAAVVVGYGGGAGKLTIKDGVEIRNNRGRQGGAVWVYANGELIMEGGRIYGNYGTENGGGVYNSGTFRMRGGVITDNASKNYGGGVSNTGNFYMESGTISENRSSAAGGGIIMFGGTVTITGGSVTDNTITGIMGGGILPNAGTLIVSGSPVIQDNTGKDGAVNNVYLKDNTMSVSAPLAAAARIGVTTKTSPTADAPVAVTGTNQADYSGSFFSDNKAYQIENTAGNVIQLAVHVHSYGSDWESDATGHWHGCSCGDKSEEAAHSFGEWTVTKEATESEDGVKERSCSVCQYKETEVIPKKTGGSGEQGGDSGSGEQGGDSGSGEQGGGSGEQTGGSGEQGGDSGSGEQGGGSGEQTGGSGTQAGGSGAQAGSGSSDGTGAQNPQAPDTGWVEIDEEQGEAAPNTEFGMSKEELAGAVLTPEELSGITAGIVVKIILTVENVDSSVSEADKQTVQALVGDYTVGEYLDIQLFKLIGADRTAILQTSGKIRIVIDVPDSLKAGAGKTRTYAIMRVHDGAAELLSDLDGAEDTITIETDKFSTYVVVYRETNNGSVPDSEPKTGDTDPIRLYATLAMVAGGAYLLLYFEERKGGMTEQKKKEITAGIISWGRKGGRLRKIAALAAVFAVLFYYHSIGKREDADWKEACVK